MNCKGQVYRSFDEHRTIAVYSSAQRMISPHRSILNWKAGNSVCFCNQKAKISAQILSLNPLLGWFNAKERAGYSIEPRKCTNKQDQGNGVFLISRKIKKNGVFCFPTVFLWNWTQQYQNFGGSTLQETSIISLCWIAVYYNRLSNRASLLLLLLIQLYRILRIPLRSNA